MHQSIFNTEVLKQCIIYGIFRKKTLKCHFISTLLILNHTALYSIIKGSPNDKLNMQIVSFPKDGQNVL